MFLNPFFMAMLNLYHGTSRENLGSLLEKGILPWNLIGRHNWGSESDLEGIFTPKKDCVYLGSFCRAKDYAYLAGGNGIVLRVEINTNKLESDEDSFQNTWKDSLKFNETCAYHGKILPKQIKEIIYL